MNEISLQTRREFLKKGLTVAAAGLTVPSFVTRTAWALNDPRDIKQVRSVPGVPDDRILVVLQLAGGNDGLNTIVPYANDDYYRVRPTLGIPREQVLRLNDQIGMHPQLAGLKSLYDDGKMAIVQGVGYPNPNRSHFRSMEIWETASGSDQVEKYGWIGRYFDNACSGEPSGRSAPGLPSLPKPTLAVTIGNEAPRTIRNTHAIGVSLEDPERFRWMPGSPMAETAQVEQRVFQELNQPSGRSAPGLLPRPAGASAGSLDFLQRTAMNARVSSDQIREVARKYRGTVVYPPAGQLSQALRLIASMIAGNLGTRVYFASLGGFDTHSGQRGTHTQLLTQLGATVRAFYQDLQTQGNADRVLVMSFSEFGRRVAENASGGTDHGTAAPMFLFGTPVKPGLYGQHPSLTDLDNGDLKFTTDFRSVYATVLEKWLGADPRAVLNGSFPTLACV
jgi:uncharacterized protein (DUF1501 family)